jgi:hypothetical protein
MYLSAFAGAFPLMLYCSSTLSRFWRKLGGARIKQFTLITSVLTTTAIASKRQLYSGCGVGN